MARIYLIGPMGSGKSTVGKSLARKLQFEFYDSDREIEARCGVDIPTIFEFEGETGFRKRERKVLSELASIDNAIIATGGGIILNRANRKLLRESGHVILLAVDLEEQLRRVSLNRNRPLLQVGDVETKLRSLMDERHSLYESTAHHIVSTNSSRMQNVVAKITRHLTRHEIVKAPAARAASGSTTDSGAKSGKRTAKPGRQTTAASNRQHKQATKPGKPNSPNKKTAKKSVKKQDSQNPVDADRSAGNTHNGKKRNSPPSARKKVNTSQKKP